MYLFSATSYLFVWPYHAPHSPRHQLHRDATSPGSCKLQNPQDLLFWPALLGRGASSWVQAFPANRKCSHYELKLPCHHHAYMSDKTFCSCSKKHEPPPDGLSSRLVMAWRCTGRALLCSFFEEIITSFRPFLILSSLNPFNHMMRTHCIGSGMPMANMLFW